MNPLNTVKLQHFYLVKVQSETPSKHFTSQKPGLWSWTGCYSRRTEQRSHSIERRPANVNHNRRHVSTNRARMTALTLAQSCTDFNPPPDPLPPHRPMTCSAGRSNLPMRCSIASCFGPVSQKWRGNILMQRFRRPNVKNQSCSKQTWTAVQSRALLWSLS